MERKQAALAAYGHKGRQAQAAKGRRRPRGAVEIEKSAVEAVGPRLAWGRVLQGYGRSIECDGDPTRF
jgi:hypothetical protein